LVSVRLKLNDVFEAPLRDGKSVCRVTSPDCASIRMSRGRLTVWPNPSP